MDNSRQQLKRHVKKHIPKDWLCELRIAYRILMEAVNDIKRTGIINIVIITTMAAILTIFGILFRFTLSLSTFAGELGNVLEISVYLKQNAQVSVVKDRIKDENLKKIAGTAADFAKKQGYGAPPSKKVCGGAVMGLGDWT